MILLLSAAAGYLAGDSTERDGWWALLVPVLVWMGLLGLVVFLVTRLLDTGARQAPAILRAGAVYIESLGRAILAPLAPLLKAFL